VKRFEKTRGRVSKARGFNRWGGGTDERESACVGNEKSGCLEGRGGRDPPSKKGGGKKSKMVDAQRVRRGTWTQGGET